MNVDKKTTGISQSLRGFVPFRELLRTKKLSYTQRYKPQDGAEQADADKLSRPYWPHWCIHGRLDNLTPWFAAHPGGQDFPRRTKGTDCTVAFEVHPLHEALLRRESTSCRIKKR